MTCSKTFFEMSFFVVKLAEQAVLVDAHNPQFSAYIHFLTAALFSTAV